MLRTPIIDPQLPVEQGQVEQELVEEEQGAPVARPEPTRPSAYRADVQADQARRLLGVAEGADVAALRAAYRRLLRSTHPDVSERRDATARTIELTAAYRLLVSLPEESEEVVGHDGPPGAPDAPTRPAQAAGEARDVPARRVVDVALLEDQTIGIAAPPDETLLLLLEAAHDLGEVSYLDPSAGLLEVVVEFVEAPTSSILLSLQGRATGITEVFCTVEPLSGGEAPPGDAVARLVVDTLLQAFEDAPRGAASRSEPLDG